MRPTADAVRAGDTIDYWCHVFAPLDLAGDYETILGGLLEAKRGYHAARVRHDHTKAAGLLQEITDLTYLAAQFADGLTASRRRFLRSGRPWPLARLS